MICMLISFIFCYFQSRPSLAPSRKASNQPHKISPRSTPRTKISFAPHVPIALRTDCSALLRSNGKSGQAGRPPRRAAAAPRGCASSFRSGSCLRGCSRRRGRPTSRRSPDTSPPRQALRGFFWGSRKEKRLRHVPLSSALSPRSREYITKFPVQSSKRS